MQITNLALCFFVAMGAVASPIDTASGGLEARDEAAALRDFPGVSHSVNLVPGPLPWRIY
jgi:hypothetical protein